MGAKPAEEAMFRRCARMTRHYWMSRRLAMGLAVLGGAILPHEAWAQAILRVTPTLNTAIVFDSNLFARPDGRRGDVISRLSPAIDAEYRSPRLTLFSHYTTDAERFADHSELTNFQARQDATVEMRYHLDRRFTVGGETTFSTTQTPGEFNTLTALIVTRAPARRITVRPTVSYQLDPVTDGRVEYALTDDRIAGGIRIATHSATITGQRRLSTRDSATIAYGFRAYQFASDDATHSQVLTVGWRRDVAQRTSISLNGGPRIGQGTTTPELSASIQYRLAPGELALSYARSQTTLIGLAGTAEADSVFATATYGRPASLQIRIAPGLLQTARAGMKARVYQLGVSASQPIGRTLALETAYDVVVQHGDIYGLQPRATIIRHLLKISVAATPFARPRG